MLISLLVGLNEKEKEEIVIGEDSIETEEEDEVSTGEEEVDVVEEDSVEV